MVPDLRAKIQQTILIEYAQVAPFQLIFALVLKIKPIV